MPHGSPRVVTIFVLSRLTGVAASPARGCGGRRVKLAGILALSERRASNQRNQRESSDKHLHNTSPCYGRSSRDLNSNITFENLASAWCNGARLVDDLAYIGAQVQLDVAALLEAL